MIHRHKIFGLYSFNFVIFLILYYVNVLKTITSILFLYFSVRRRYIPSVDEISSNNKKDDFNVQIKLVKKKKKIKFDSDVEEKEIKKKVCTKDWVLTKSKYGF